jgi:serine/threonine protein kinase
VTALPEPGVVFADKYVVESTLGRGAAGVVFAATHRELRQRVAIKVLRDAGPNGAERMIREARAALALHSEHVVRVMDVGRDQGRVFLVMEHLAGADLGSLLKERGPFPVAEAVDCVLQACAGVAEAHARGVVHRDLKPTNLFLTTRADGSPLVKVLDFGISKSEEHGDPETSLTGPAELLGSPMYMSPEQVRGAKYVDHRTDIWSLGVIVFRLVTGKAPFGNGSTVSAALASVVADAPASMRGLRPEVPRELEAVVLRCLDKSPAERFATVAELAAALAPFGTDDGRSAVVRLVRDRSTDGRAAVGGAARRARWPWLVAAGIALLAVPAAALAVLHRTPATPTAASAPDTTSVTASASSPAATPPSAAPGTTTASPPPAPAVASTSATTTVTAKSASPPTTSTRASAPPIRRTAPRVRPTSTSSVVRSAATDDRY